MEIWILTSWVVFWFLTQQISKKKSPLEVFLTPGSLRPALDSNWRVSSWSDFSCMHLWVSGSPWLCVPFGLRGLQKPPEASMSVLTAFLWLFSACFLFTSVLGCLVGLTHRKPQPSHLVVWVTGSWSISFLKNNKGKSKCLSNYCVLQEISSKQCFQWLALGIPHVFRWLLFGNCDISRSFCLPAMDLPPPSLFPLQVGLEWRNEDMACCSPSSWCTQRMDSRPRKADGTNSLVRGSTGHRTQPGDSPVHRARCEPASWAAQRICPRQGLMILWHPLSWSSDMIS